MEQVIIGVDPHKLSATIEIVDHDEQLLGSGRFTTDQAGYTAMRRYAKTWPDRVWAVEGANGAGRPLAQRLLEAGEHVVDVPAKLAARIRLFDTGHNRKTDARDAHSIAVVAARILADVGDVARFADRNRFASWTGTAPLDASSGEQNRHRLSRAGNRRINHMIHIAAVTQLRHDSDGQAYYRRKRAEVKKPMEALRCLKRRISDTVYRQLVADAAQPFGVEGAGPGGHCGASQESSAVDRPPHIDTSDQPLPGSATTTLRPPTPPRKTPTSTPLQNTR